MNTAEAIARVESAIAAAERGESKLTPEVLSVQGMSSPKVRHFLSNLVQSEDCYLEIGSHKGSTLIAAIYGKSLGYVTAIDNFSSFGSPREEFTANLKRFGGDSVVKWIDMDCFAADTLGSIYPGITVYFFDGPHTELDQWRAVALYLDKLAPVSIYICDDWRQPDAQTAWRELLKAGLFKVAKQWELPALFNGDCSMEPGRGFWNGLLVSVIEK